MFRVKIFVDFWNFQLDWNSLVGKTADGEPIRVPWESLFTRVLCDRVGKKANDSAKYSGTYVYASVNPATDKALRSFLHVMDSFPGYKVVVKERKARRGRIRCNNAGCKHKITHCPSCSKPLKRSIEKGVDTAILTDMIQMAHDDVYDMAVLASNDADLCQAIEFIQDRLGKHIFNLWYPGIGDSVRNVCWDHFPVPSLLADMGITLPDDK